MSAVVSDTSPLHYLVECEAIEILPKLFGEVLIPPVFGSPVQCGRLAVAFMISAVAVDEHLGEIYPRYK